MRKMKDSGIEWIGQIPSDWDVKRLKYIVNTLYKGNGITKDEVFLEGNIECVRYGEIYSKYSNSFSECISLTKEEIISSPQYFSYGDILFAGTGELVEEIGKNIVYLGKNKCLAGGDIIIAKHSQNPSFLNYALNSSYCQYQKSKGKAKLKVVHITASQIGNILVFLPPLAEQQKIANFLDEKCGEIDLIKADVQRQIELLNDYKKSVITEAVTKGLNPKAKLKDSGIEWIGKIPEQWRTIKTGYCFSFSSGDTLTSEDIEDEGDYIVYGANGIRGYYSFSNLSGKHILIGRVGALCGNVHIVDGKVWVTEHALIARKKRVLDELFFGYIFSAMNLGQYSKASAQPVISSETLASLKVPFPPLSEQKEIANYLDDKCTEIDAVIADKQKQLETLDEYKKSLIFEYVTGKKEVVQ